MTARWRPLTFPGRRDRTKWTSGWTANRSKVGTPLLHSTLHSCAPLVHSTAILLHSTPGIHPYTLALLHSSPGIHPYTFALLHSTPGLHLYTPALHPSLLYSTLHSTAVPLHSTPGIHPYTLALLHSTERMVVGRNEYHFFLCFFFSSCLQAVLSSRT